MVVSWRTGEVGGFGFNSSPRRKAVSWSVKKNTNTKKSNDDDSITSDHQPSFHIFSFFKEKTLQIKSQLNFDFNDDIYDDDDGDGVVSDQRI